MSAGPTREKIDPVRFLTNFSSGKMGYAMAEAAAALGAETILVSGPVELPVPDRVKLISVESAEEMLQAILNEYERANIVIKTAAVADYRPKHVHEIKMKKQPGDAIIELERTTDILKTLGEKKTHQLLIGFAAETNDVITYAKGKLHKKNADYIVANDVTEQGSGFGTDTNAVILIGKNDYEKPFETMSKQELAKKLLLTIIEREAIL